MLPSGAQSGSASGSHAPNTWRAEYTEIAKAFLLPEPTLAQRVVRAKRKIQEAGIPYEVPAQDRLPERLAAVEAVVYLIFNEGYTASSGRELVRTDLCAEAIRLGRVLVQLLPREAEAIGLLALMLLQDSRRDARVINGQLVTLQEQDRSRWDTGSISEGLILVEKALAMGLVGPYQLQAAIAALHAQAPSSEETDWPQIAALYGELLQLNPSPVIALNRAVAVAMSGRLEDGLSIMAELREHRSARPILFIPCGPGRSFASAKSKGRRRCGLSGGGRFSDKSRRSRIPSASIARVGEKLVSAEMGQRMPEYDMRGATLHQTATAPSPGTDESVPRPCFWAEWTDPSVPVRAQKLRQATAPSVDTRLDIPRDIPHGTLDVRRPILVLVIAPVPELASIPAIGVPVILAVRRTKAVSRDQIALAVAPPVLEPELRRRTAAPPLVPPLLAVRSISTILRVRQPRRAERRGHDDQNPERFHKIPPS